LTLTLTRARRASAGGASTRPAPAARLLQCVCSSNAALALFDLGERAKVVILSVTEGDDKPLEYPHMFRAASLLLLNKLDLLPHVDFDVASVSEAFALDGVYVRDLAGTVVFDPLPVGQQTPIVVVRDVSD
jgi:CobW/HypB/UreG, nucleotide-binding domain